MHLEHASIWTTGWDAIYYYKVIKIKIILSVFSDHNAEKVEINHKIRFEESPNIWKLKKMLLNNY